MIDGAELGLPGPVFPAGSVAPPGRYRRVDALGRDLELPQAGPLPPSFDGRVALYVRLAPTVSLAA